MMDGRPYRPAREIALEYLQSRSSHTAHYKDITDYVLQVDGSCLTKMGGKTPSQTMGAVLRSQPDIFVSLGAGIYALRTAKARM